MADINPGSQGSYPTLLVNLSGTLFFDASDGVHGAELWRSGGTAQTTSLVKDINPAPRTASARYDTLVNANGTLFFFANDGMHGAELWQSDGTAAGTVMVKDISPGPKGSYPYYMTNINGTLFFSANDGTRGREPWILGPLPKPPSGAGAGTATRNRCPPPWRRALSVTPLPSGEMGKSEGASQRPPAPTPQLLRNINLNPTLSNISGLEAVGSTLFFAASDAGNPLELWESNGAVAGTQLVWAPVLRIPRT